ncbi:MAG: TrkH family potassium uptake protein [Ruminococcaceae bacterium]|nr:TrkH family potassium uptake protein [Oscillospiraceae bacterium]
MNYKMMGRLIGSILAIEGVFMIPAVLLCLHDGVQKTAQAFLLTIAITLVLGAVLLLLSRRATRGFYAREGLVCVGVSWVLMSVFGCLPFVFSGEIPHFIDALFETVSGFTTTGATILSDVEALSRGALYWRSFTHWLGGMGVLVFVMAVIPTNARRGGFAVHLLRAESTGPQVDKLVSRTRDSAVILYGMYILLTVLNVVFLLCGKMPLFDAVCTAFGTAGTGGFGVRNDSIAAYSPYLQNVTTVFMLLFGVNFACYYLLLLRRFRALFKDEELRLYLGLVLGSVVLIVFNIRHLYPTLSETIRHAAFQVSSIITTTGFATTDFNLWPSFSKAILLTLMVTGCCAGSTGGGLKCGRVLLLIKGLYRNLRRMLHPQRVETVRVSGRKVDEAVLHNTNIYLVAYALILAVSFLLVSLDNFSVTTNFSAVIACFNNIGPGFEAVGPTCNFGGFGVLSKIVLAVDMLAGRLEIFPVLVLLSRSTWTAK